MSYVLKPTSWTYVSKEYPDQKFFNSNPVVIKTDVASRTSDSSYYKPIEIVDSESTVGVESLAAYDLTIECQVNSLTNVGFISFDYIFPEITTPLENLTYNEIGGSDFSSLKGLTFSNLGGLEQGGVVSVSSSQYSSWDSDRSAEFIQNLLAYGMKVYIKPDVSSSQGVMNQRINDGDFTIAGNTMQSTQKLRGFPSGQYVNQSEPVEFDIRVSTNCIGGPKVYAWESGEIEWKDGEEGTSHFIQLTPDMPIEYTVSTAYQKVQAGELPASDNLKWRYTVNFVRGGSQTSDWFSFTTLDTAPTATPISPSNVVVDGNSSIKFEWKHTVATGFPPTRSDLQISSDGWNFMDLATIDGSETTYTAPGLSFQSGVYSWRVRTYNANGIASSWSDALSFSVETVESPPVITGVTNSNRPTVSWQSTFQKVYQIRFVQNDYIVYDSGTMFGDDKSYRITGFLKNGEYETQLRIQTESGLWGDWVTFSAVISPTGPQKPKLYAKVEKYGVELTTDSEATTYILRDGVPIIKMVNTTETDYTSCGRHEYVARAVDENGNYSDSDPQIVTFNVRNLLISIFKNGDNVIELEYYIGSEPVRSGNKSIIGSSNHFSGRSLPVYEFSEFEDETLSLSFSLRKKDIQKFEFLKNLMSQKSIVVIRSNLGDKFFGVIETMDYDRKWLNTTFDLSVKCVDCKEQIQYD